MQAKLTIVLTIREITSTVAIGAIARDGNGVRLLHRAGVTLAIEPNELIVDAMVARLEQRGHASS